MTRHRHDHSPHAPEARPASAIGANARGSTVFGAIAGGALAIGAAAIGRLAIGRLAIGGAKVKRLEIGELVVNRVEGPAAALAGRAVPAPPGAPAVGAPMPPPAPGAGPAPAGPAGPTPGAPPPRPTAELRDRAARWVRDYERVWRTAGTDAVADLFDAEASYSVKPFQPTLTGLAEIAEFWDAGRDGPDEAFTITSEHVAAEGDTAVVRTEVVYGSPPRRYRNLWVVTFGPDGRAVAFEEWPFAPGGDDEDEASENGG
jgi:ketosteroid isomerase-like protein